MITNIKKNIMGTVNFDGKFNGMRKAQDFICYPLHAGDDARRITVQSKTRIGYILATGEVLMSPARAGGSYQPHLALSTHVDTLTAEDLLLLQSAIQATASGKAGQSGLMLTDNSEAISFGATP